MKMGRTNSALPQVCADARRSGISRECTRTNTNRFTSSLPSRVFALIRGYHEPPGEAALASVGWPSAFFCVNLRLVSNVVVLILLLVAIGCRSRVIKVTLTNTSEQPLSAVIVDYPDATFGVNTLPPGRTFQYTIKPLDSGALKIQFTDAGGKTHNVTGPAVRKGQEGSIAIRINQDSASAGSALQ
jgi:hypothetical protein